jgi:chemotaxis protein methyltransferase CheR
MVMAETAAAVEDLEIELLLEALFQRAGYDFRGHDRAVLRTRLHGLMEAQDLFTVSALQERVLHHPGAGAALLRALSVAPALLFDDPQQADSLRAVVRGCLGASAVPKVWLVECAGAEEAWSLAILLAQEQLHQRTEIFATMVNGELLAEAEQAGVPMERMAGYQENFLKSGGSGSLLDYFEVQGKRAVLLPRLRARITWAQYNLVTDASFNEFQLILCQRALADFGPPLRQRVLRLFHDSLARFGVLGIGGALGEAEGIGEHYQPLAGHDGFYKRTV